MTHNQIRNHVFGDAELDGFSKPEDNFPKPFNYYLRGALLSGKITKNEYLRAEYILATNIK